MPSSPLKVVSSVWPASSGAYSTPLPLSPPFGIKPLIIFLCPKRIRRKRVMPSLAMPKGAPPDSTRAQAMTPPMSRYSPARPARKKRLSMPSAAARSPAPPPRPVITRSTLAPVMKDVATRSAPPTAMATARASTAFQILSIFSPPVPRSSVSTRGAASGGSSLSLRALRSSSGRYRFRSQ